MPGQRAPPGRPATVPPSSAQLPRDAPGAHRPRHLPMQTPPASGWGERPQRGSSAPSPQRGRADAPRPHRAGVLPTERLFHRSAPGRRASRGGGGAAASSLPSPRCRTPPRRGRSHFGSGLAPSSPPPAVSGSGNQAYVGPTYSSQGHTARASAGGRRREANASPSAAPWSRPPRPFPWREGACARRGRGRSWRGAVGRARLPQHSSTRPRSSTCNRATLPPRQPSTSNLAHHRT